MTDVLKYAEKKYEIRKYEVHQIGSLHILTLGKFTVPLKEWVPESILRSNYNTYS